MFKYLLAVVLILAVVVSVATAGKACSDEKDAFCNIVGQFCDDKQWAELTAKCAKTCKFC